MLATRSAVRAQCARVSSDIRSVARMFVFLYLRRRTPIFTLFPYTTLFRSPEIGWVALEPTRLAVLDHDFVVRLHPWPQLGRSEEHTSELQSLRHLVCRLLLGKNNPAHRRPSPDTTHYDRNQDKS